jgi:hypothetical protein
MYDIIGAAKTCRGVAHDAASAIVKTFDAELESGPV